MTNDIDEAFAMLEGVRVEKCPVCVALASLSVEHRNRAVARLSLPREHRDYISREKAQAFFEKVGFTISDKKLYRHRNGDCSCTT